MKEPTSLAAWAGSEATNADQVQNDSNADGNSRCLSLYLPACVRGRDRARGSERAWAGDGGSVSVRVVPFPRALQYVSLTKGQDHHGLAENERLEGVLGAIPQEQLWPRFRQVATRC